MSERKVALVVGAGDATGGAIARRFAREGFVTSVTRRTLEPLAPLLEQIRAAGGEAHGFGSDARVEAQVVSLFEHIEREIGPIEVLVFNIGGNVNFPIAETTERVFRKVWEMSCLSGFLNAREAAKVMQARRRGTILFTGATASVRGREGFSAFAGAKHALRALAQSLAREVGPKGVHVAHVIVDGAIDGTFTRERMTADQADALLARGEIVDPAEVARNYVWLHHQGRSAWTHEMDLRPWTERW